MKVYIAGPFFNPEQLSCVKSIEEMLDKLHIEYFSPRLEGGILKDMKPKEREEKMEEVYYSNVDNVFSCDTIVAVVDGKDTGTLFELGYAVAVKDLHYKKYIITFTEKEKSVNVMLRFGIDAHALGIKSLKQIIELLENGSVITDEIANFPKVNT